MSADKQGKAAAEERESELMESPLRKSLRNAAFQSLSQQGRTMKRNALSKNELHFTVGSIVQVPLHDVDTTKADGKTLTLVVVEVVKKRTILVQCIAWPANRVFWTVCIIPGT